MVAQYKTYVDKCNKSKIANELNIEFNPAGSNKDNP